MKARLVFLFVLVCGLAGSITSTWLNQKAMAARNSSGTYSLYTPGNPVVTGTTISTAWANSTLADIGTELTNSLDRNGRGAMAAPLGLYAGNASVPGLAFSAETSSGLYRNAAHDVRMSINGSDVTQWTTSGLNVIGNSGATNGDFLADSSCTGTGAYNSNSILFGGSGSGQSIASKCTSGTGQFGLEFYTNSGDRMSINNAGGIQIPGELASTPGTAITASYGGSYTVAFGTLSANNTNTVPETLTGATVGGVCEVSPDADIGSGTISCFVNASNSIQIRILPNIAYTLPSRTYRVRVWQP